MPPRTPAHRLQDRFDRAAQAIEVLLQNFPGIYQLLGTHRPPIDKGIAGWGALQDRYWVYQSQGRQPVLVATMFGPTGAGKSTLFRLFTGIDVPAGDTRRPMTYACAMAVPPDWTDVSRLQKLFPGFTPEPLQDVQQLCQLDSQNKKLKKIFYHTYTDTGSGFPLILVDVPDFDSIEKQNWEKAEALLQRAEIVIFLTTGEKYADDAVVKALARACRLAARLVYVFTKTASQDHAQIKWEDLLHKLTCVDFYATRFREKRSNGQTLLEFLKNCPVYFSPWSSSPRLEDVQALSPHNPKLDALLQGLPAENLLLESFLEPAIPVVQACQRELIEVQGHLHERRNDLNKAKAYCAEAAHRVAASLFPFGRMIQIMYEEVTQEQWLITKILSWPLKILSAPLKVIGKSTQKLLRLLQSSEGLKKLWSYPDARPQADLEREHLSQAVEALLDKWRGDFRPQDTALLEQTRLELFRQQFLQKPLPPVAINWETLVRQKARQWAQEHPFLVNILPTAMDALALAGGAVLAIDLFTTGGAIGIPALMATTGGAAHYILQWMRDAELDGIADEAHRSYVTQRSQELQQHLEAYLFKPIFQPWQEWIDQVERSPRDPCQQACADLQRLLQETSK